VLVEWQVHLNLGGPDSKHAPEYVTNVILDDSKFVTQSSRGSLGQSQFCHIRQ